MMIGPGKSKRGKMLNDQQWAHSWWLECCELERDQITRGFVQIMGSLTHVL